MNGDIITRKWTRLQDMILGSIDYKMCINPTSVRISVKDCLSFIHIHLMIIIIPVGLVSYMKNKKIVRLFWLSGKVYRWSLQHLCTCLAHIHILDFLMLLCLYCLVWVPPVPLGWYYTISYGLIISLKKPLINQIKSSFL